MWQSRKKSSNQEGSTTSWRRIKLAPTILAITRSTFINLSKMQHSKYEHFYFKFIKINLHSKYTFPIPFLWSVENNTHASFYDFGASKDIVLTFSYWAETHTFRHTSDLCNYEKRKVHWASNLHHKSLNLSQMAIQLSFWVNKIH